MVAFEVAGASANPLVGASLNFQGNLMPGSNTIQVQVPSAVATGIFIAVATDDLDATAPTVPLVGSGFSDGGQLWDFFGVGNYSARAEYALITSAGTQSALFSPQEEAVTGQPVPRQLPDYTTTGVIFH